jgi:hypothetical protein
MALKPLTNFEQESCMGKSIAKMIQNKNMSLEVKHLKSWHFFPLFLGSETI